MIRIVSVSIALLGWIVFGVFFAVLLPSAAQATCSRWDASGEWVFVQSNDTSPQFTLQQTETGLQGSASYSHWVEDGGCIGVDCDHLETVRASVDGTIDGDSFEVTAYWNNGTTGLYTGKIGSQGRIVGSTYDKQHPQTMANWYSDRVAKCLTSAGGTSAGGGSVTPPVNDEGTIKAQGRVKTGKAGPSLSICEAAEKARARNSPAAPGLEAKCRAATSDTVAKEDAAPATEDNAAPAKDEACTWRGEAPWCEGRCAASEIKMAAENDSEAPFPRAHPDFGTSCATGFKLYCCRQ